MTLNGHELNLSWTWVRFFGQLMFMVMLAAGIYFRMDNRVTNLEKQIVLNAEGIRVLDSSGTRRSHELDTTQQLQIDENAKRIANLEKSVGDLSPKVDRIEANTLWLMGKDGKR